MNAQLDNLIRGPADQLTCKGLEIALGLEAGTFFRELPGVISNNEAAFVCDSVAVLQRASDVSCALPTALDWFLSFPIEPFGNRRPVQLVAEGRADAVLAYIDSIESGFVG